MASSDDDEDLKLAMALSLQQCTSAAPTNNAVVDLTSDNEGEDDDDLKRAIALSLQENGQSTNSAESTTAITDPTHSDSTTKRTAELTQQTANVLTSSKPKSEGVAWDRKAMEQERLARLEKRKRKRSLSPDQPSKQLPKVSTPVVEGGNSIDPKSQSNLVLQYPRGAIKRTFATKFPRTDDITIDELLQAPMINMAVISSFQFDADWLGRKLSHTKVKQVWVMNARDADTQARWRRDLEECGIPNLRIHFPPMNPVVGNAHSKYMLLAGEEKLRVVVSTANMEPEYWGK